MSSGKRPAKVPNPRTIMLPRWRNARRVVGAVAVFGLVRACATEKPPPKSLAGLIGALGMAVHGEVAPSDFVWEGSEGVLTDFFQGRRILFLAAERPGAARDLYRARVRLSPEGRPLAVRDVVNLTSTPDGDERELVRDASADRAAFATIAYGKLQGVTALDLRGSTRAEQANTTLERWMFAVTNWQETGDTRGISRLQIAIDQETRSATLAFAGPLLVMRVAFPEGTREIRVDVDRAELKPPVAGVHADLLVRVPKKAIHWAVDTVRAVPWIGPVPIAWLEAKVWELKDRFRRFNHEMRTARAADEVKGEVEQIAPRAIDPTAAGEDGGYWPPQSVPTIYRTAEPGEGVWEPFTRPWLHGLAGAPPAFYRTFVRPDPLRPFSKIVFVAMDTRQLDFDMEAGVDDPKPTVGSFHGTGRLPREAPLAKRAVAAWNGGFKTEHGHYGMMLRERVFLPPVPNAATAVVTRDGRFGLGSWSSTRDLPPELLSFRQNMDPLVEDGLFNPRQRSSWGAVLPGQPKLVGQQTERSGLCLTKARHLLYVWGDDVGADALGKAMLLAGCDYGMHLDMNPFHTGFVFFSFDDPQYKNGRSEVLTPLMAIGPRRYIDYNPKDFFYALVRDPVPPPIVPRDGSPTRWQPDPGVQPPPSWIPAIQRAELEGVSLVQFEPGRLRWTLRAGTQDREARGFSRELGGEDAKRAIAATMIGTDAGKASRWLSLSGKRLPDTVPVNEGALVLRTDGTLVVSSAGEPIGTAIDVLPGNMLIQDGQATEHAAIARHDGHFLAIGVAADGRLFVARLMRPDGALARVLLGAGCVRAVLVSTPSEPILARAGTPVPPMTSYPHAVLYGLAQPMLPRAFRYDRGEAGQPRWPAVTKPVP